MPAMTISLLPAINTLRHMMHHIRNHNYRQPYHAELQTPVEKTAAEKYV